MLIDTRDRPDPEPEPEPLEVNWRLVFWIALTLTLFLAAKEVPSLLGVVFAFAGLCTTFKILEVVTGGWGTGLREWRQ